MAFIHQHQLRLRVKLRTGQRQHAIATTKVGHALVPKTGWHMLQQQAGTDIQFVLAIDARMINQLQVKLRYRISAGDREGLFRKTGYLCLQQAGFFCARLACTGPIYCSSNSPAARGRCLIMAPASTRVSAFSRFCKPASWSCNKARVLGI